MLSRFLRHRRRSCAFPAPSRFEGRGGRRITSCRPSKEQENTQELLAASVQHLPHSAAKTQRPPLRCSPRRLGGAEGQGTESVKTIRLGAGGCTGASGTNRGEGWRQRIRTVRARFASAARAKQTIGRIRAGSYHAPLRQSPSRSFLGAPSVSPTFFSGKIFRCCVRGVLRPAAETPPSPARRWGDSISPALTERRELSGRAIVHRIVRCARQAHEVPETVRILRVILGRPDVMHHLRRLAPTVPGRFPAPISVPPERQRAQPPPALVLS